MGLAFETAKEVARKGAQTIMTCRNIGSDKPNKRGGFPVVVQSNAASHNEADAPKLWQVSEDLTGVQFNWEN